MTVTKTFLKDIHLYIFLPGGCLGVDLNRNFPSGWGEGHKTFVVDSALPWTGVYKGPTRGDFKIPLPFSRKPV